MMTAEDRKRALMVDLEAECLRCTGSRGFYECWKDADIDRERVNEAKQKSFRERPSAAHARNPHVRAENLQLMSEIRMSFGG